MASEPMNAPASALPSALLAACLGLLGAPGGTPEARAEDPKAVDATETARRENVERLERDLRKMASSGRAAEKKAEIRKVIESLGVLGGVDGAKACLDGLAFDDADVEKDVLQVLETVKSPKLVAPLGALIEHKDYRRRFRLHAAMAHTFAVIADASAIEHLTALVRSEDAAVVAAGADALATFRGAPHAKRVEPVRRMLDKFESTWNLKMSVKLEDRVRQAHAEKEWDVFGKALKAALQALTGQSDLATPRQFRDWWNDHKKATNW
jgi:hypothetical protein